MHAILLALRRSLQPLFFGVVFVGSIVFAIVTTPMVISRNDTAHAIVGLTAIALTVAIVSMLTMLYVLLSMNTRPPRRRKVLLDPLLRLTVRASRALGDTTGNSPNAFAGAGRVRPLSAVKAAAYSQAAIFSVFETPPDIGIVCRR
jgi:hypothetical protein